MPETLLPPSLASDASIRALESLGNRLFELDLAVILVCMIDLVDASTLPHLAWQWSMLDEPAWSLAETEAQRRELLKQAIPIHARKGTPWAVKSVLALLGHADAELIERRRPLRRGQGLVRGAGHKRVAAWAWATYRVQLARPITERQAQLIIAMLQGVDRAVCKLERLEYPRHLRRGEGYKRGDGFVRGAIVVTEEF